jgi:hypothetical protein
MKINTTSTITMVARAMRKYGPPVELPIWVRPMLGSTAMTHSTIDIVCLRLLGNGESRCTADARIVRVLDFERAFAMLEEEQQLALALIYRDNQPQDKAADAIGCSQRKLCYPRPART